MDGWPSDLEGNVSTIEGFEAPTGSPTAAAQAAALTPVNILIMGSDNRADGNSTARQAEEIDGPALGHHPPGAHLGRPRSAPWRCRSRATLCLTLPKCASESGQWEVTAKFNSAFTYGGANCTVETVERMTGLQIDHAVVIDFNGFKRVVDALGGVEVCLAEPTRDPNSGLNLPAGQSDGVRRSGTGLRAGPLRARRRVRHRPHRPPAAVPFLGHACRRPTPGCILEPLKLYRVLDAATQSLTRGLRAWTTSAK